MVWYLEEELLEMQHVGIAGIPSAKVNIMWFTYTILVSELRAWGHCKFANTNTDSGRIVYFSHAVKIVSPDL